MKLCGFLSPRGKFIECDSYEHLSTAKEICEKTFKVELTGIKAEDFLYDKNYVGFYSRNASKRWHHSETKNLMLLTSSQIEFIVNNLDNALNKDQLEEIMEVLKWNDDFKEDLALNSVSKKYVGY